MAHLFCLTHSDGDWFFVGPKNITEEEFRRIVLSILPEAAAKAWETAQSQTEPNLITWRDLTKWIPEFLKKAGFEPIKLKWTSVPHYDIVNPDNVPESFLGSGMAEKIKEFNIKVMKSFKEPKEETGS